MSPNLWSPKPWVQPPDPGAGDCPALSAQAFQALTAQNNTSPDAMAKLDSHPERAGCGVRCCLHRAHGNPNVLTRLQPQSPDHPGDIAATIQLQASLLPATMGCGCVLIRSIQADASINTFNTAPS